MAIGRGRGKAPVGLRLNMAFLKHLTWEMRDIGII